MLPFLQDHTPLMAKIRDPWVKRDKLRVLLPRVRETTGQITGSVSSFRPACPTGPSSLKYLLAGGKEQKWWLPGRGRGQVLTHLTCS